LAELSQSRLESWSARYPRGWPWVFFPWFAIRIVWVSVQIGWWWVYVEAQRATIWLIRTVLVVKRDE